VQEFHENTTRNVGDFEQVFLPGIKAEVEDYYYVSI
jgi:hypothetical protein